MAFISPRTTIAASSPARIKVIGVGGGGQNAVDSMIELGQTDGVEFIAMNTDAQVLNVSRASIKIQLGPDRTHGLGSGADPQVGAEAASESIEEIKSHIMGADMIFIAAGLGGGTGTGAAPVVAKVAHDLGVLTVGVVTKPFTFEGKRRMNQAEQGIRDLKDNLDALIVIPNQKILEVVDENMPLKEAFKVADQVIGQAVEGISDLIISTGLVNVDFADVKSVMQNAGSALMGIGYANGENRAEKAAKGAINSPLLDVDIKGCTGLLINIVGDDSLSMFEVSTAAEIVSQSAHEGANIIFGANVDPTINGIKVTVIATGFESDFKNHSAVKVESPLNKEEIINQIDSRFDQIQKESMENKTKFAEEVIIEETLITRFDEFDEKPFDINEMRKAVAKMEHEEIEKNKINEVKDDDFDLGSDVSSDAAKKKKDEKKDEMKGSSLWKFIKDRSKS
jgi:cell division protein FtsZ